MCAHVYVIMHVKDPKLSVLRVGQVVLLAGFCLSLYSLHVLNRDVNMMQRKKIMCLHDHGCIKLSHIKFNLLEPKILVVIHLQALTSAFIRSGKVMHSEVSLFMVDHQRYEIIEYDVQI